MSKTHSNVTCIRNWDLRSFKRNTYLLKIAVCTVIVLIASSENGVG